MSKAILVLFFVFNILCSIGCVKGADVEEGNVKAQKSEIIKDEAEEADLKVEESGQGDFIYIEGDVKIREKDSLKWIAVTEGTKLSEGVQIKLGKNSFAEVRLGQNKKMQVNEETMVAVQNKPKKTSLDVIYGSLKAKVKKIPGEELEVRTPVAVAAVRGTEFAVTHEQEDTAEVEVYDGDVAFRNITKEGEGEEITVTRDQWAKSVGSLKPVLMGKITAIKALRWKHLRARKEQFMNLRRLKRIKMDELRLNNRYRLARDPEEKKKVENLLTELAELKNKTQDDYADNKKILADARKEYRKIRMKSSSERMKFIKQRRKKIASIRRERIKKAKERMRERRQNIKDRIRHRR